MKLVHSRATTVVKRKVKIEPLEGGYKIEKSYAERTKLNGKTVQVKGKVVKFSPHIMNRNWIHIQDGTGKGNDYNLVVTSNDEVKVGGIVLVEGRVSSNKDFAADYFFTVVIENAEIEIE